MTTMCTWLLAPSDQEETKTTTKKIHEGMCKSRFKAQKITTTFLFLDDGDESFYYLAQVLKIQVVDNLRDSSKKHYLLPLCSTLEQPLFSLLSASDGWLLSNKYLFKSTSSFIYFTCSSRYSTLLTIHSPV